MRISWDDFCHCCRRHRKLAAAKGLTDPLGEVRTEQQIAEIWRALDDDCSGWIALKEFDPPCFHAIKDFKTWAVQEHGGCVAAMKKLDANGNGRLNTWELKKSD